MLTYCRAMITIGTLHPYRPVWYVPNQGLDYTILDPQVWNG